MVRILPLIVAFVWFLVALPGDAQPAHRGSVREVAASSVRDRGVAAVQLTGEQRAVDPAVLNQLLQAERRSTLLEMKSQLQEDAYTRLEVIIAAFGSLMTVLVVSFGIATYRSAANAARSELADVKERVQALRAEAEVATAKSVEAARSADESATSARTSAEQAHSHERSAEQDSAIIREAAALAERQIRTFGTDRATALSPMERETVADAAREVGDKPQSDWTADDFRVRILGAVDSEDWTESLRLAAIMRARHERDPESLAFALFSEAISLRKLGRYDEAFERYRELGERLGRDPSPTVRRFVAMGLSNMAINLGDLGRYDEGIQVAEDVLHRFEEDPDEGLHLSLAKTLATLGYSLAESGRYDEAIAASERLIARFGGAADATVLSEVALAMINKAGQLIEKGENKEALVTLEVLSTRFGSSVEPLISRWVLEASYFTAITYARMKMVRKCIDSLETWKRLRGGFDCEKIRNDVSFDAVRNRPSFVQYMSGQGCDAPPGE
jgi:tetratricopeptide (TPR) repeat protein